MELRGNQVAAPDQRAEVLAMVGRADLASQAGRVVRERMVKVKIHRLALAKWAETADRFEIGG